MSGLPHSLVLIPALNEAASIKATIQAWRQLGFTRLRVVDNGSTDATVREALSAGAEVLHEPRRGYGAAAWRGLQAWPGDCEWVLFSSADGSDRLSTEEISQWQRAVDAGADLVLGDRTALEASRRHLKLAQRLGNWICVTAIAWGWGRRFRDMASLRLVRRSALESMQLRDRGFGWNVEMQVRALELGLQSVEIPVGYYPRLAGESKISGSLMGTLRAARGIVRMLFYLYSLRTRQSAAAASHAVPV